MKTCKDCKWNDTTQESDGYGQCHKKTPIISANMDKLHNCQPGGGYFPIVWDRCWCGEFQEKEANT